MLLVPAWHHQHLLAGLRVLRQVVLSLPASSAPCLLSFKLGDEWIWRGLGMGRRRSVLYRRKSEGVEEFHTIHSQRRSSGLISSLSGG